MNPLVVSAIGLFLSASVAASVQAAPTPAKALSKPGMKNAKKVMVAKLQHDAKGRTAKKQAIAVRRQTVAKKAAAQ
jgi:hypothetical protein